MKQSKTKSNQDPRIQKLIAVFWVIIAVFFHVSLDLPGSTGLVGEYLVQQWSRYLLGYALSYSPIFFLSLAWAYGFLEPKEIKKSISLLSVLYLIWALWVQYQFQGQGTSPDFVISFD